jgi:hypothetical protein
VQGTLRVALYIASIYIVLYLEPKTSEKAYEKIHTPDPSSLNFNLSPGKNKADHPPYN